MMVQSQFTIAWEGFKSSVCSGFSSLQQNGELVDMTLAADGYFVKVHQVLMALVSPYLKELITSAPCQHPVIFLNNVTHKTLCALLEYIYTGEVVVSSENLNSFVQTAKNLHIKGLEDFNSEMSSFKVVDNILHYDDVFTHGIKKVGLPSDRGTGQQLQVGIPAAARKIVLKKDPTTETRDTIKHTAVRSLATEKQSHPENKTSLQSIIIGQTSNIQDHSVMDTSSDMQHYSILTHEPHEQDTDDDFLPVDSVQEASKDVSDTKDSATANLQYTVSIRGSLQIILNRYMYNLFSIKNRGEVRRWRCVDYRNHHCKAFVVTKGNVVLNRGNLHNHPFHDKKILQKIENEAVFSALEEVEVYKQKEFGNNEPDETQYAAMELEEAMVENAK